VSLGFGAEVDEHGDIVITELVPGFAAYLSNQVLGEGEGGGGRGGGGEVFHQRIFDG